MKISELPYNVNVVPINIDDFEGLEFLKSYISPITTQVYYYNYPDVTIPPVYDFLGGFDFSAKQGDICRIYLKVFIQHSRSTAGTVEYKPVYYMWTGVVTDKIIKDASCRIGRAYVKTILIEKARTRF